jgi:hypothetical protein
MHFATRSRMSIVFSLVAFAAVIGSLLFFASGGPTLRYNDFRQVLSNNPC